MSVERGGGSEAVGVLESSERWDLKLIPVGKFAFNNVHQTTKCGESRTLERTMVKPDAGHLLWARKWKGGPMQCALERAGALHALFRVREFS